MNRKKRKEAGAIAIEAVLSLTIFMLAILALMMGSLLIRAQASMQYALNQTAKEISGYFYLLDKFGIASAVSGNATLSAQAKVQPLNDSIGEIVAFTGNVKKTSGEYKQIVENAKNGNLTDEEIERIKNLPDDATTLKNEAKEIAGHLKDLTDDPKRLFSGVFQVFGKAMINTALSKYVTPFVCEALMPKYLTLNKNSSAFYQNTGIIESTIDFDGSQMLADGRTISLVVTYEVDASKLTLGFYKKHLKFQQIASTCAWIRGNDSESLYSLEQVNQLFQEGRIKAEADRRRALNEKEKAEEEERKKKEAEYSSELDEHKADETSKPEKEEEEEEEEEESSDSEVSSEDIKKFLEQHPECQELYDNYGADVIKAVNNCSDPNAAITLLLNAEKGKPAYGKEAVAALKQSGDKAVDALKVVEKQGDHAAAIVAANGPEAIMAIGSNDSPKDAIKAIERATDKKTVIQALNLAPTKECAVAIMKCDGSTAAEAIVAAGKGRAAEAVDAITNGEDPQGVVNAIKDLKGDALDVFKKVKPTKTVTDTLKDGKFAAVYAFTLYGEDAVKAIENRNSKNTPKAVVKLIAEYDEAALVPLKNGYAVDQIKTLILDYDEAAKVPLKNGSPPDQIKDIMEKYQKPGGYLLKNGVTTEQITALADHGLTPDWFKNDENPFSNWHCNNKTEAEYLLNQYNAIHEKFDDAEIKKLEEMTMAQTKIWQDKWKNKDPEVQAQGKTNKEIGPAVAGVYWKDHGDPFFATNALKPSEQKKVDENKPKKVKALLPNDPEPVDSESEFRKYFDLAPIPKNCDSRLKDIIERMPDDVYASYEDHTDGAGSHAEIYAVNEALKAGANPEDLLVYVNHTGSSYTPFVTCPHCEWILKELGVKAVSNVEIKNPKDYS